MVSRTVFRLPSSISCHSKSAGLPSGWTSKDPQAVDLASFYQQWPQAMTTDLPSVVFVFFTGCFQMFEDGKQKAVSLFSGVGGLDLGLSERCPQLPQGCSRNCVRNV